MGINEKIKQYINSNLIVFDDDISFTDDDNIFKRGFVNSLFAMKIITYIESEFNIEVSNEEIEISNFNSVNNIVNFINSKKSILK